MREIINDIKLQQTGQAGMMYERRLALRLPSSIGDRKLPQEIETSTLAP